LSFPPWRARPGRFDFARENFLGIKTLQTIADLKRQLLELLSASGFVRPGLRSRAVEQLGRRAGGTDGVRLALAQGVQGAGGEWDCPACNVLNFAGKTACFKCSEPRPEALGSGADGQQRPRYSQGGYDQQGYGQGGYGEDGDSLKANAPLLQALLVAALFPQIVTAEDPKKNGGGGLKFKARDPSSSGAVEVALHPSCVAGKEKFNGLLSQYFVYHEMVKTTRVYVRDATPVTPHALLLFGGRVLTTEASGGGGGGKKGSGSGGEVVLKLDGWLGFKVGLKLKLQGLLLIRTSKPGVTDTWRSFEGPNSRLLSGGLPRILFYAKCSLSSSPLRVLRVQTKRSPR
jgi:hypothetical protein